MKENKPVYTEEQIVFCLSLAADTLGHIEGIRPVIEGEIAKKLNKVLSDNEVIKLIGSWKVVWGPGVFQVYGSILADNSFNVVKSISSAPEQYVVAIAGTVERSLYAWLFENLDISITRKWPYGSNEKVSISNGTWTGLKNLQAIRPGPGQKSPGDAIEDFIKKEFKEKSNNAELVIAGHSLGGNLAAVFALWLADIKKSWDPKDKAIIKTYPSAGATSGNKAFAEYFDQRFDDDHAHRIWNSLDVIPHVWYDEGLAQIPGLYKPKIEHDDFVELLINMYRDHIKKINYTHVKSKAAMLSGTVKGDWQSLWPFIVEMVYQHVQAYIELLKVKDFEERFKTLTGLIPGAHLEDQTTDKKIEEFIQRFQELKNI